MRCYAKVVVNKLENDRVIGMHYMGPNAGEITQGFSIALLQGITKEGLNTSYAIHPTVAEVFLLLFRSCCF